jgi:2-dehydro-3-deoxyphosphooctonate aldolase (KDO 8-P synthase)
MWAGLRCFLGGDVVLSPVARLDVGKHDVAAVAIGGGRPLTLIAGPCVIESLDHASRICAAIQAVCAEVGIEFVFKSSFDKANRTSISGFRGPGFEEGLAILAHVRSTFGVPVTTDVHESLQAAMVAEAVDLLQVPAFLCRQTDLLVACAKTGLPVNVKKGQFMAPWDMSHAVAKLTSSGAQGVLVTERGASFGYNNLVADMRALPITRSLGVPVCFDATHSVQLPGAGDGRSGGQRDYAPVLARAAVAAGVDAVFLEVHDDPDRAPSDGPNMVPLSWLPGLLQTLVAIDALVRR